MFQIRSIHFTKFLSMRTIFLSALLLLHFSRVLADNRVTPSILEVTVYRSGAKVSSVATVRVPAGNSEVVFENLSPYFNPASLQVKIAGTPELISAVFLLKKPGPGPEHPRAAGLRDSLVLLSDEMVRINDERQVLTTETNVINSKTDQVGTISGTPATRTLTVAELRELTTFYRQRLLEIKGRLLELVIQERKTNELYRKLQETLQRLQPNTANQTGEIILKIDAPAAQSVEITCTYLITNAGWTPLYDLRSEGLDKALRLIYKANVHNQSGFDWKNVQLHLSTANPLVNNNRPIMTPVFVDFRPIHVAYQYNQNVTKDVVTYNMAQVQTTDVARSAGAPGMPMEEVVIDEPAPDGGADNLIATFDLAKPQTILADGEENVITVDEQTLAAEYEYHAVPKLDPAVFLLAKIADYGKYNLLPGTANIFYQETYVGQTFVNPQTVADTLLISLGRDEQITIKRVQPKDFTERKKIFNSSVRETYTYEIAVKNNKSVPIRLEILDQVPVSKQKEIEVNLEEKGGAEYTEAFGKLKWELNIPANQSKKVRFSYSVKYPKDKPVQVVRQ